MNEIPKISITQDFVTDDHDDDESECSANINDAHTDIEDLDSDDKNSQFASSQLLQARKKVKSKKIDDCATDVEDCDGSASDDDFIKSCDDHLSLTEFLDQGFVEETCGANKSSQKGKRASLFLPPEDDGAVTDCEDMMSDSEILVVNCQDNSKYDNFLLENDDFSSVNVENSELIHENKKKRFAASKHVDYSDSDGDLARGNWNELSDVENFALSDQEDQTKFVSQMKHSASAFDAEEMIMVASDTEMPCPKYEPQPDIAVSFTNHRPKKSHTRARPAKSNQNQNTLVVQGNADEGITDVENLDSSDDEGTNLRKNLAIPLAYVSSGNRPLTDVEDFDVDEECIASTSKDIKLPSPVREITVMREDKHGDPVAKVMPLVVSSNGSYLGIKDEYVDKGLTDTEDLSGNEEDFETGIKYEIIEVPNLDGGVVTSADGLTSFTRDRKSAEFEQLTDVEEIRMNGNTKLRRKRSKPKSIKTKGGLLAVNGGDGDDQVLTENEELYVSDDQAGTFSNVRHLNSTVSHNREQDGGVTDTEDFSGDEGMLKKYNAEIDPSVFQQEAYFSTITSTDGSQGKAAALQGYSKISTTIKTREAQESSADLSVTDVEDLVQSDGDELLCVDGNGESVSRGPTPNLLRNAFNESASSRVHDQSKSGFDIANEAAHIKGYEDIQANHTDTECLE